MCDCFPNNVSPNSNGNYVRLRKESTMQLPTSVAGNENLRV